MIVTYSDGRAILIGEIANEGFPDEPYPTGVDEIVTITRFLDTESCNVEDLCSIVSLPTVNPVTSTATREEHSRAVVIIRLDDTLREASFFTADRWDTPGYDDNNIVALHVHLEYNSGVVNVNNHGSIGTQQIGNNWDIIDWNLGGTPGSSGGKNLNGTWYITAEHTVTGHIYTINFTVTAYAIDDINSPVDDRRYLIVNLDSVCLAVE